MRHKVRAILDAIDSAPLSAQEARDLWYILTALRASDVDASEITRAQTTERIRAMALPRLCAAVGAAVANYGPDLPLSLYEEGAWRSHFGHHVFLAMAALKWADPEEQVPTIMTATAHEEVCDGE